MAVTPEQKRALFLDRDGVINRDTDYVWRREDFVFLDGIFDIVRSAYAACLNIVVVTNQSGIGRGYYTQQSFHELSDWMRNEFCLRGAPIDAVYHCPYHRDARVLQFRQENHPWRKPNPGMLVAAASDLKLTLSASLMIGDRQSDYEAAHNAGLAAFVFVGQGNLTRRPSCKMQVLQYDDIRGLANDFPDVIRTSIGAVGSKR